MLNDFEIKAQLIKFKFRANLLQSVVITVIGDSMKPTYKDGDKVRIHPFNRKLKTGDIVLYNHLPNSFTIHRICEVKYCKEMKCYTYKTKGDNNSDIDPYTITDYNIIGIV